MLLLATDDELEVLIGPAVVEWLNLDEVEVVAKLSVVEFA